MKWVSRDLSSQMITFNKTNLKLETDLITRITSKGIETKDNEHELDIIIYATGFDASKSALSFKVVGKDG